MNIVFSVYMYKFVHIDQYSQITLIFSFFLKKECDG